MNVFGKTGMVFLIILNTIFIILGLGLIVAGSLLRNKSETVNGNIPLFNKIDIGPDFSLGDLLEALSIIVISIGVIVLGVSATGAFGSCCKNRPLLIIYGICVILIGAVEIFVIKSWFDIKKKLNDTLKSELMSLLHDYDGNNDNVLTVAWNFVFLLFNCCGVNAQSYVDDFSSTIWASTRGSDVTPGYCCVAASVETASSLAGTNCTTSPTSSNANVNTGCYTAIEEILTGYSTPFITLCVIILAVECVAVICAVLMIIQVTNDITSNRRGTIQLHNMNKVTWNHSVT